MDKICMFGVIIVIIVAMLISVIIVSMLISMVVVIVIIMAIKLILKSDVVIYIIYIEACVGEEITTLIIKCNIKLFEVSLCRFGFPVSSLPVAI